LTAFGQTQVVPAGTSARVPLGADGQASGPPEPPQPYDTAALQSLPLKLSIWEPVTITPALTADQITAAVQAFQTPGQSGTWTMAISAASAANCSSQGGRIIVTLTFGANGSLSMRTPTGASVPFTRTGDTTYTGTSTSQGITDTFNLNFTSSTTFTGQQHYVASGCTLNQTISGTK
jgi:hypothetical protein